MGISAMLISEDTGLSGAPSRVCMYPVCALEEIMEADSRWRGLEEAPLADSHLRSVCARPDGVFCVCNVLRVGGRGPGLGVPVSGSQIFVT